MRDLLRHQLLEQSQWQRDGVRLPSEHQLAVEYTASRNAVRHALAALQNEGFVRRTQGFGTSTRPTKVRMSQLRLRGLALGLARDGDQIRYEVHHIEHRPASTPIAEALGIPVGSRVAVIERHSYYNDEPLSLNSRFLPAAIAERFLAETDLGTSDWFGALERAAGVPLEGARTITEAALADEWLAPDLGIDVGAAVFLVHRTVYDINDRAVEFELTRSRGDLLEMESWTPR